MGVGKLIYVFGLKRSGNHALVEYILGHIKSKVSESSYENPRRSRLHINNPKKFPSINPGLPREGNVQIISVEDNSDILSNPRLLNADMHNRDVRSIVVLRDPYNWIASLKAGKKLWKTKGMEYITLWKQYARKFFQSNRDDIFPCKYNSWFASSDYRKLISKFIGEPHTEAGLNRVTSIGSSFDKLTYDGKAQKMDVLNRWKHLDKSSIDILENDSELRLLSNFIFGFSPDLRYIN